MYIQVHCLVHMVHKISLMGPLYITSMFPYERLYRKLRTMVKNPSHADTSLLLNTVMYSCSMLLHKQQSLHLPPMADLHVEDHTQPGDGPLSLVLPYKITNHGKWEISTNKGRFRVDRPIVMNNTELQFLHMCVYDIHEAYANAFDSFLSEVSRQGSTQ